ncbi:MAG: hypothetical protein LBT31_10775 [Synergistaceae bacterium]|nr:hypothetical protein [Synergistaceae bacterium]
MIFLKKPAVTNLKDLKIVTPVTPAPLKYCPSKVNVPFLPFGAFALVAGRAWKILGGRGFLYAQFLARNAGFYECLMHQKAEMGTDKPKTFRPSMNCGETARNFIMLL